MSAEELLPQIADSIRRAAWRMERSQHQDGGWGQQIEQSNFWHSLYAVLFLNAARFVHDFTPLPDIENMLRRGVAYLEQHPEQWAADTLTRMPAMPVYEMALMIRCFYRVGRSFMRRESALRLYRSIDHLYHIQNDDGGWDAHTWGYQVVTPTRVWSEVGATSIVLQSLAETHNDRFASAVEKGIAWLVSTQNPDGSWNNGSRSPDVGDCQLTGQPAVNKTCDAVKGILVGEAFELPLAPYRPTIDRAIAWLCQQEEQVLSQQDLQSSCGCGYTYTDYENTCVMLETVLRLPGEPMPNLDANVTWLLQGQRHQADDPEDGEWPLGHTARIGLALATFHKRVKEGLNPQTMPWIP